MKHVPKTILQCLSFFVSKQKWSFLIMFSICIIVSLCQNSLWPYIIGSVVDKLTTISSSKDIDKNIIIVVFSIWLLVELVQRAKGFMYAKLYSKFEGDIRVEIFSWIIKYPYTYFSGKRFGIISYRVDDFPRSLRIIIDVIMVNFIPLLISIIISIFLIYNIHKDLATLIMLWFLLYGILLFLFVSKSASKAMEQSYARGKVQSSISDSINNYFAIQTCNGASSEIKILKKVQDQEVRLYRKTIMKIEESKLLLGILNMYFVYITFNTALNLISNGEITIGNIAFMFNTTISIMTGLWYASDEINYFMTEIGTLKQSINILKYETITPDDINEEQINNNKKNIRHRGKSSIKNTILNKEEKLINTPDIEKANINEKINININTINNNDDISSEDNNFDESFEEDQGSINSFLNYKKKTPINITRGEIVFKDVHFGHKEPNGVFTGLNVTIKGREKVGLVGFSGSGKTSFVYLIVRLYNLNKGNITIDNQDIMLHSISSIRKQVIIMQQEPVLFSRSVRDNIKYGCNESTDEEMVDASIRSHSHSFIMNLPEGYDTIIGPGSNHQLSGGQKQRIIIARAILRNAPIIIMDEATSALDSSTESKIQESINNLISNKTVLIIAHRLSTVLNMDRIFVFKNGNIIEEGTHNNLIKNNNTHYFKLWQMQQNGFLPEKNSIEEDNS
ncbi:ABC transporter ATP-binding protein [Lyticum sinuosum]|uniref:ABC transporter ATP-binding/permease protein n=1 Tax=Lyticum sinuosum TaxID=1332059 RepID=A0AAE5AGU7_9RICK|nr:ABC transporter ATP-binding protein [Lyticum sinuosum]MDZ5761207.1 ABC transporter ATP-binding/permease protein [Lyticum sinuosum]